MHWQTGPAGPARYVMLLFGGLTGVNFSLALLRLPSLAAVTLAALDLSLAGWIVWLWLKPRNNTAEEGENDNRLLVAACLAALSPLSHLYLVGDTDQITAFVITTFTLPWVFRSLSGLSSALVSGVVLWGLAIMTVASPASAAISTTVALVAATIALGYGVVLNNQHTKAGREEEQRQRLAESFGHKQKRLAKRDEREHIAVEASCNGYWYWDLTVDEIQFSESWAAMLGYRADELGTDREAWFSRVHHHYLPKLQEAVSGHLYGKTQSFQSQYRIKHRDGTYLWVLSRGVALRDAEGSPIAIAGSQIDITQLVDVEQSIVDEAYRDRLTALPNREAFHIRLEQAVAHAKSGELESFAVMFLDLDRFKVVNDSLGHLVGDQLLVSVSARLRNCTRQSRGDLIARFGGDEFVVLLEELDGLPSTAEVLEIAKRMIEVMEDPFRLGEHEIRTGVSVGIAFWEKGIVRSEDLLRNADTAMYHAKAKGRGQIEFFNTSMHAAAMRLNQLQNDLVRVIDRQELLLHYQPIVSTGSGKIACAEALIRWRHSDGKMIGPSEFIPIAEESGQIEVIGEWALRSACVQAVEWQMCGLPPLKISVNVSPQQLRNESFPSLVATVLTESGLDPNLLELEITETALMSNVESTARTPCSLGR
jgi:diguanylate cyclase (GGDEF)-like protein/PAS domain S-box-containing protein